MCSDNVPPAKNPCTGPQPVKLDRAKVEAIREAKTKAVEQQQQIKK